MQAANGSVRISQEQVKKEGGYLNTALVAVKCFAETAGTEQDIVFTLFFEDFYKGCFVNVEVPLCDERLKVADTVRGFHIFSLRLMGERIKYSRCIGQNIALVKINLKAHKNDLFICIGSRIILLDNLFNRLL